MVMEYGSEKSQQSSIRKISSEIPRHCTAGKVARRALKKSEKYQGYLRNWETVFGTLGNDLVLFMRGAEMYGTKTVHIRFSSGQKRDGILVGFSSTM